MAINENTKELIMALAGNDITKAKKYAKIIVEADDTAKNRYFCSRVKNMLESQSLNLMELPANIKGLLSVEDVSASFNEQRYYLSSREKKVFDNIITMQSACQKLAEMRISYLNSTLLYGASGTGKTLFGRYVAYKLGLPFAYLNFSHVIDSRMGDSSKNIARVFDYVRQTKCVFMLDEVDCISIRRSSEDGSSASQEMSRITITLMQELDKLSNDLILIGATNRKDRMDEALLRRFSIHHEVLPFSSEEKSAMVTQFLDDVGIKHNAEDVKIFVQTTKNTQAYIISDLVRLIANSVLTGSGAISFVKANE